MRCITLRWYFEVSGRSSQRAVIVAGQCFVFDNRVAVDHDLSRGSYDQCHACRMPITEQEKQSEFYQPGLSCHHCHDSVLPERKQRFAERQKQIDLAAQRSTI